MHATTLNLILLWVAQINILLLLLPLWSCSSSTQTKREEDGDKNGKKNHVACAHVAGPNEKSLPGKKSSFCMTFWPITTAQAQQHCFRMPLHAPTLAAADPKSPL
jgi:hypothetical protein